MRDPRPLTVREESGVREGHLSKRAAIPHGGVDAAFYIEEIVACPEPFRDFLTRDQLFPPRHKEQQQFHGNVEL